MHYLQGFILGVSLAAPIGPVTILMLDKILKKDIKSAYAMSLSAISGDFSWMILSYFGISVLITRFDVMPFLRIIGILILFGLGFYNIYEYFFKKVIKRSKPKDCFIWVYLLTVTHPFTILLWAGIFSLEPNILYGLSMFIGVAAWFLTLPLLLNVLPKPQSLASKKVISLVSGIIIVLFAVYYVFIH